MKITNKGEYSSLSDDVIIKEITDGNEDLLSVIFERYRPVVSMLASRFTSCPLEHDDLVQEGLIALYTAVRLYDFSSASFATFASICVKRGMISALRQSNKARHIPNDLLSSIDDVNTSSVDDPETSLINRESFLDFINEVKKTLSSFEYTVLSRYLLLGNYNDVCNSLNITRKEADNALQRARKKIKKLNGEGC